MFIQVITGQVGDKAALEAAMDRWERELRPSAPGFLGETSGVTDDGRFVCLARFESPELAAENSNRPEQGAWWAETEKCFSGPVTFLDCTDVDVYRDGGSDQAGFVQVMQGRADRDRLREIDAQAESILPDMRPDLLGSIRAWKDDQYTEAAYFTSEADARAAESQEPPPELAETLGAWQEAMGDVTWYDLRDPKLIS